MSNNLPIGSLKFADTCIPELRAGEYSIDVTSHISGGNINPDSNTSTQNLRVAGPRFALDISSIYSCSPSPGSQGVYETHLPDIVISEPFFPWERTVSSDPIFASIPWVGLVVLSADDLLTPTLSGNGITGPNADKVYTMDSADKLVSLSINNLRLPNIPSTTDDDKISCKLIVISGTLFGQLFSDMSHKYYAHCRKINSGPYQIDGLTENGEFSVVFASRFPKASSVNYVHLVSLEGHQQAIQNSNNTSCCLVSLYSWSFVCDPTKNENFYDLMGKLAPTAAKPMQVSSSISNPEIQRRLSNGFVPVKYHLRTGEDTIGWYRGPFTPVQVDTAKFSQSTSSLSGTKLPNSLSGTNLLVFDPVYGTFDVTYAAAWQLGRSLALSSTKFLSALMEFRQTVHQSVNTQIANQMYQVSPVTTKSQFIQNLPDLFSAIAFATSNNFDSTSISQAINLGNLTQNLGRQTLSSYWPPSPDSYNGLVGLTVKSMAADNPNYQVILQWLSQIWLLRDVPFHYLIPNQDLLPIETMRFFFVDSSWLDFAIDGALSLAVHSDQDQVFRQEIKNQLAINAAVPNDPTKSTTPAKPLYGLIIRSVVVADWPGLVVTASTGSTPHYPIQVRRLPPNILMAFFLQPITSCRISQPPEQFRFGASGESSLSDGQILYRLDTGKKSNDPTKIINPTDNLFDATTINTSALLLQMHSKFGMSNPTPSQFAIQMIGGAEYQDFSLSNSAVMSSSTTRVQILSFSGVGQSANGGYSTTLSYSFTFNAGPCYWKLSSPDSTQVCSGVFPQNAITGQLQPNNLQPATFTLTIVDSVTGCSDSKSIVLSSLPNNRYTYT